MESNMISLNWTVGIVGSPWVMHRGGNFNSNPNGVILTEPEKAQARAAELNAAGTGHHFEARIYNAEAETAARNKALAR